MMGVLAFISKKVVRPAFLTIAVYFLVIVISLMTMVKPANASGSASTSTVYSMTVWGVSCSSADLAAFAACVTSVENAHGIQGSCWVVPGTGREYCDFIGFEPGFANPPTSSVCPDNSTPTSATSCTCNTDFKHDTAGTSCVPEDTCKVKSLTPLPADDACAEVLENINSTQAQKDAACGALTDKLKTGMACFRDKLSLTNDLVTGTPIPLKITGDIRDIAYQAHLRDIWDKMERLVRLENDPAKKNACAARRAEVAAEKGCDNAGPCLSESCSAASGNNQRSHCLKHRPAPPNANDAKHTQGNAFDVSEDYTIDPLQDVLDARNPQQDIQQYLDAPQDCKLIWGGNFDDSDPVHFQAR